MRRFFANAQNDGGVVSRFFANAQNDGGVVRRFFANAQNYKKMARDDSVIARRFLKKRGNTLK